MQKIIQPNNSSADGQKGGGNMLEITVTLTGFDSHEGEMESTIFYTDDLNYALNAAKALADKVCYTLSELIIRNAA